MTVEDPILGDGSTKGDVTPMLPRDIDNSPLANEDIACDVDEILWPDPARQRDDA